MASYGSYKKIVQGQIIDGTVPNVALEDGAGLAMKVKYIYGQPNVCTPGCCCLWTVPTGVKRVTFEIWGSGGNGHGACSCNRCHHYAGAGGGYYNSKTISVQGGWSYTLCASGVYRCCSRECQGCNGCSSYVNGCNLSNFCAIGGNRGMAETNWSTPCFSSFHCCLGPTSNNGDFGMGNHYGAWGGLVHSAIVIINGLVLLMHHSLLVDQDLRHQKLTAGWVVDAGMYLMVLVDRVL